MEKSSPHYGLAKVTAFLAAGQIRTTKSAREGAIELGLEFADIKNVIAGLTIRNFYKSMTTLADHTIWQDVYHAETSDRRRIYLKLTIIDDILVISFKER